MTKDAILEGTKQTNKQSTAFIPKRGGRRVPAPLLATMMCVGREYYTKRLHNDTSHCTYTGD